MAVRLQKDQVLGVGGWGWEAKEDSVVFSIGWSMRYHDLGEGLGSSMSTNKGDESVHETMPFEPEDAETRPDYAATRTFEDGKTLVSASAHGVRPLAVQVPALQQIKGPGAPQVLLLSEPRYVLGRSPEADFTFDSAKLSRRHVELRQCDGTYMFVDLESTNGVFINGVKAHSSTLTEGDMISIGDIVFQYRKSFK